MALVSRIQMNLGHQTVLAHPDFDKPWCKKILDDPNIRWTRNSHDVVPEKVSNSMFEQTLYTDRAIRAHLSFSRPCNELDSIRPIEDCFLISVGDGVDGATGRAHGGFNSLLLDHACGHAAHHNSPNPISPATATMTVDFKRPISTPCVVLCRSWLVEMTGRKMWTKAVIEDEHGQVLTSAKCLFIAARTEKI